MRRIYQNEYPYFVTIKTIQLIQGLFEEIEHAVIVADTIRTATALYSFDLFGFVIMPDHVHILLKTKDTECTISKIMQGIKATIYMRLSRLLQTQDVFWQRSFYANIKDTEKSLQATVQYMRENPKKWDLPEYYNVYPYQFFDEGLCKTP